MKNSNFQYSGIPISIILALQNIGVVWRWLIFNKDEYKEILEIQNAIGRGEMNDITI